MTVTLGEGHTPLLHAPRIGVGEAEQQMIARYTFAANGRVLGIQYRMQKSLIDMLA